ncbi:MAG: acetyl/propionyl/methylcrotonyl-CoA carboxylase subunit alpha [Rhodoferax sp.]|nr:acetyl/propionyl/methylcrotonyl-CoA carboxylase subunit alpha [Rhodoferax sp.]
MFNKILIANRGEIACRVAATARRMGIRTVAVYSDADASAKHVAACDEAVHIGGSAPRDSYLQWQRILQAAQATGAQAVHPGYGFLSENDAFAQACADAGLVFIGPSPAAIRAMGLKAESKQLMEKAGVPLVPGYHGADQDPARLQLEADSIGYPVLIKASAGGGGKGMRAVDKSEDFAAALASCQREARNSFGDDAVLIERYVQRPRHIEIQVFGDTQGNYVYLHERDCSVQRRHQKVLEEAPAPGMTPALRQQMGEAAVAAARAVDYVGAGTVEFIVETSPGGSAAHAVANVGATTPPPGRPKAGFAPPGGSAAHAVASVGAFYFMEMNTRLQVEHPVTEAITELDLVEWQLRVASGEPLPLQQHQLRLSGHAIEARICAENPDNNFLPATGRLDVYALPACSTFERADHGVRVDSGVRQGDAISPYYDSMVAKLIVHGDTREEALAKLDVALAQTHIVGLQTNVQFLRHVVQSRSFARADLDTALIPREAAALFGQTRVSLPLACAAEVARTLLSERAGQGAGPFGQTDGWRSLGEFVRRFSFRQGEHEVSASLRYRRDGSLQFSVAGMVGELHFAAAGTGIALHWGDVSAVVHVYRLGDVAHVHTAQGAAQITVSDLLAHPDVAQAEGGRLTAPMPGKVVSFAVKAGDRVKRGQALAVLDAMKMEHTIAAPADGVVAELLYAPGDQVGEGAALITLTA